jgi:nuclear pore complex protein Nup54
MMVILTNSAIERVRSEQARLVMRVLRVNKKLEVLMQKGQPLNNEDVALRNILSSLLRELHKPSQYRGRLNELKPQLNHYLNQPCMTIDEKSVGDEEVMKELQSFLLLQTQGLAQLVDIVKRDQQDVEYIGKQLDQLLMIMRK